MVKKPYKKPTVRSVPRPKPARDWSSLYREHRGALAHIVRCVLHHTGASGDVEDVVQEAFAEAIASEGSYSGRTPFQVWLSCVCRYVARGHVRRLRRAAQLDALSEQVASSGDDPVASLGRRERARRIDQVLVQLAPLKRQAFVQHDLQGVPTEAIAAATGAPVLTVRTRLFYGRRDFAAAAARDPVLAEDLAPWLSLHRQPTAA